MSEAPKDAALLEIPIASPVTRWGTLRKIRKKEMSICTPHLLEGVLGSRGNSETGLPGPGSALMPGTKAPDP